MFGFLSCLDMLRNSRPEFTWIKFVNKFVCEKTVVNVTFKVGTQSTFARGQFSGFYTDFRCVWIFRSSAILAPADKLFAKSSCERQMFCFLGTRENWSIIDTCTAPVVHMYSKFVWIWQNNKRVLKLFFRVKTPFVCFYADKIWSEVHITNVLQYLNVPIFCVFFF